MNTYNLDVTAIQESIYEHVIGLVDGVDYVVKDGLLDDEQWPRDPWNAVAPGFVLWFHDIRRAPTGRSFGGTRMDSYRSRFDIVSVAGTGDLSRANLNKANDLLIGWKPLNSGELVKGSALWGDTRPIREGGNVPSRFVTTSRFDFGVFANRVEN